MPDPEIHLTEVDPRLFPRLSWGNTAAARGSPTWEPRAPEAQGTPRDQTKHPSGPEPGAHLYKRRERERGENLTNQQIPPSHRRPLVAKVPRVGALGDFPIWPHRGEPSARRACVYDCQGHTTGGNPVQAGLPLPVLKLRRQVGKGKGNPTERVSTGTRVSMPRLVFDDNDENEVEAEVHK
jgi:hypothetical protein